MPGAPASIATIANADVRRVRERLGMTQQQLAAELKISKLTVLRWEHGRSKPSNRLWERLGALAAGVGPQAAPRNNIPIPPNALIGRHDALAELQGTLATSRLVTLAGTGGSGKTRLATALATAALDRFADGAWFIDLAPLTAPELVTRAVASVLGVRDRPGDELRPTLLAALGSGAVLLVLDNCEHLLEAAASFAAGVMAACPNTTILATSREPLGLAEEHVFHVLPLTLPEPTPHLTSASVREAAAGELFFQRAAARDSRFELTDGRAAAVATICGRLDGLPLALELAAAWTSILAVDDIATRLDDRFQLLVRGDRFVPERQQTLRAAIDWSYALLSSTERLAFDRVSAFAGSFELNAAAVVAAGGDVAEADVLSLLGSLIDKSLVTADVRGTGARYSLLESLRAYGRDRLAASDEVLPTMGRLAGYYLRAAQSIRQRMRRGAGNEYVASIGADMENYRSAMQWLGDRGEWDDYLQIAGGIWNYWEITGAIGESRYWLERGLHSASHLDVQPATRARALGCLGQSLWRHGSLDEAEADENAALAIYLSLEDSDGAAWARTNLGGIAYGRSNFRAAGEHWTNALETFRDLGEQRQVAILLNNLGLVADREGDSGRAAQLIGESAAIRRDIGDHPGLTSSLINLASLAARRGDELGVRELGEEALDLARSLGQRMQTGAALQELARADFRAHDYALAESRTLEALDVFIAIGYRAEEASARALLGSITRAARKGTASAAAFHEAGLILRAELGDAVETGQSLLGLAALALEAGEPALAGRLLGAVSRILDAGTLPPGPEDYATIMGIAGAALPPAALRDAHPRGASEPLADVVAAALAWTRRVATSSTREHPLPGRPALPVARVSLTRRELMIMGQVAAGSLNKEIAATTGISIRTVERHIATAYAKLGARGRADAVRILTEIQLH